MLVKEELAGMNGVRMGFQAEDRTFLDNSRRESLKCLKIEVVQPSFEDDGELL
jgi:hypothetical protein